MMDPEKIAHWQAADAAFDQWLDLPQTERDAWLATQPLPEPVRRRLVQLITAHERPRASLDPAGSNLAGCLLGDWKLDTELGRGGMAVVYRAWREEGMARQQAAVKILTLGALGATGRERFQREAAILARLNHPNVTALIDSGVADDGTFWLAMPLVDGERIDRWCEAKAPDAHAIVRLYLQVCGAVAYAHRNLVIHRDIKPSNVLVDDDGHVRLLDFGIGQFADTQDERTQTMWRALTPGYAAPEQLTGAPPSTAMDVYGLGALLHRLLTGRTPQAATETDTTRPSLLVRDASDAYHRHYVPLKNDLDRVLLKALAEEPEQRYATAEALADDLRRWLDGQPVLAQKPKLGYRLRKFVTRNKMGVAASILLVASLGAGIGATLWQAGEAQREATNAKVQAQRAVLVRDFLAHVFESTEPASGGVPTALELLDEGARRARSNVLDTDPLAAADILMLTGQARVELSEYGKAREDLEQARTLFGKAGPFAYKERSVIEQALAQLTRDLGEVDVALRHSRAAVDMGERAMAASGDAQTLLEARIDLGMSLYASGDMQAAATMFEEVLQALPLHDLEETTLHTSVIDGLTAALAVTAPDDTERAIELAEEQIRVSRLVHGPDSGRYASTLSDQVPVFGSAGDHARAEELAFEAAAIADRVYTKPHSDKAAVHCQLAAHLHWRGRYAEAVEHYAIANDTYSQLQRSDMHVQACFVFGGYARGAVGDYRTALDYLERSWEILGQYDQRTATMGLISCGMEASVQLRLDDIRGAEQTLAKCPPDENVKPQMMLTQAQAELHLARGELREAAKLASGMRKQRPPEQDDRYWMRPWMLSLLLAHDTGDAAMRETLVAELGDLAQNAPLSTCFAKPDKASCLVLP